MNGDFRIVDILAAIINLSLGSPCILYIRYLNIMNIQLLPINAYCRGYPTGHHWPVIVECIVEKTFFFYI